MVYSHTSHLLWFLKYISYSMSDTLQQGLPAAEKNFFFDWDSKHSE